MKTKLFVIFSRTSFLYIVCLGVIGFTAGCRGPQVLQNRDFIPAPASDSNIDMVDTGGADFANENIIIEDNTTIEPLTLQPMNTVETSSITYTVKKGDSFWKIGRMYGVGMRELASYNNIPIKQTLKIGSVLNIPPGGELIAELPPVKKSTSNASKTTRTSLPSDGKYTVKKGDSLWKIAYRFNLKTDTLVKANGIDKKKPLSIGQVLIIPDGADKMSYNDNLPDVKPEIKKAPLIEDPMAVAYPQNNLVDTKAEETEALLDIPSSDNYKNTNENDALQMLEENLDDSALSFEDIPIPDEGATVESITGETATLEDLVSSSDIVDMHVDTTLKSVASDYNVSVDKLRMLNPDIPADGTVKAGTKIILPPVE